MTGLRSIRAGFIGVAAVALALLAGLVLAMQVSAQAEGASIDSATALVGEEDTVDVDAVNIGAPGLGAWTIDISYDASVITAVACSPAQGGVCNADFGDDMVRITGATATGLEGDTNLGSITFECGDEAGSSDLTLSLFTFADATIGGPQDIDASTIDGTFACEQEVTAGPAAGSGGVFDPGSSLTWLIAALAATSVVAALGAAALRQRIRQS